MLLKGTISKHIFRLYRNKKKYLKRTVLYKPILHNFRLKDLVILFIGIHIRQINFFF